MDIYRPRYQYFRQWNYAILLFACFILPTMTLPNPRWPKMQLVRKPRSIFARYSYSPKAITERQIVTSCYSGSGLDIVQCCKSNPYFFFCEVIKQACSSTQSSYPNCPDCSTSTDKEFCCYMNPNHSICSGLADCSSVTDVAACCKEKWYTSYCKTVHETCRNHPENPICLRSCQDSSHIHHCCDMNPKAEGCPAKCETSSEIVECCKYFTNENHNHCLSIRSKCRLDADDPVCPDCSSTSEIFSCCEINPMHASCSDAVDCTLVADKASCCSVHWYTSSCHEIWTTCFNKPEDPLCPSDCSRSWEKHHCCGLNPKANGCPTDCDTEWDVVECCRWNPYFPHCQKIIHTCASSSVDSICPDCSNGALSHYTTETCCDFNPTHRDCSDHTDCTSVEDVAACCKHIPYTAKCRRIVSSCQMRRDDRMCPKHCGDSAEKYFCCDLNPKATGCPRDCVDEPDVVECCKTYPSFTHCIDISMTCQSSSDNSICLDCSSASDRFYCCDHLNRASAGCTAVKVGSTECQFNGDVVACCKANPSNTYCVELANECPIPGTSPICPQDCTGSLEFEFCCSLSPQAYGCLKRSTECDGASDIMDCCKLSPNAAKCQKIKGICATSAVHYVCPDCSKVTDADACCMLNPTHTECQVGR